jgi:hypothetical protein
MDDIKLTATAADANVGSAVPKVPAAEYVSAEAAAPSAGKTLIAWHAAHL